MNADNHIHYYSIQVFRHLLSLFNKAVKGLIVLYYKIGMVHKKFFCMLRGKSVLYLFGGKSVTLGNSCGTHLFRCNDAYDKVTEIVCPAFKKSGRIKKNEPLPLLCKRFYFLQYFKGYV